jgi:hypothetical protein
MHRVASHETVPQDGQEPIGMTRLTRLHVFVAATRKAAQQSHNLDPQGRTQVGPTAGLVRLSVSRRQLQRALLVVQALFAEAERRGHGLKESNDHWGLYRGVAIVIRGHDYAVRISELSSSIPVREPDLIKWRRDNKWRLSYAEVPTRKQVPNGRLRLTLPYLEQGSRTTWSEGPRGALVTKLVSIIDELEARATRDDRRDEERARAEEQRQRLIEVRLERERLQKIETQRAGRLLGEVAAWRRAAEIRDYVVALRKRIVEAPDDERKRIEAWCEWAEGLADDSDPLMNAESIVGLDEGDTKT